MEVEMAQVKRPAGEAVAVARQHKLWLGLGDTEMVWGCT